MSLIIKDKVFEAASDGVHNAVIDRVEDLGIVETNFGSKDMVRVVLKVLDQKDKDGNAIEVWFRAAKSLNAKSTLGKFLASLKIFTQGQFDLNDIVGLKLQVVTVQKESNDGRVFANIATVIPAKAKAAPKAAPVAAQEEEVESF